ncbi:odorant receptor 22c [Solenopsis invicta]|uniref:odorant receptor 22c n=1 Tax=Solenopsis invicta TaxID=13686 RepID=UPI00193E44FC|nr:odorant receptor 22c [Solenopsis invicta]
MLTSFYNNKTVSLHLIFSMISPKYFTSQSTSHRKYYEWAVKLHQCSLEIIGLWSKSGQTTWEKHMCNLRALLTFLMLMFVVVIPAIHSMIRVHSDILLLSDNLQFTLPATTCVIRLAIFWWKKEAVTSIIDMIENDWLKTRTSQEEARMVARAQIARIIIISAYSLMAIAYIVLVILPICGYSVRYQPNNTDLGRPFPLMAHYVYDTNKSPQYELTYTVQSIAVFYNVLCYTGIDNFLSLSVFHISGQLDILKNRLMHLHTVKNYNDVLKSCVVEHLRLLRAIDRIEDIFHVILMILFLYFGILFAFYGFWIMNMLETGQHITIVHLIYVVSIVINAVCHMCLYCAVGEMLTAQCDGIHYAVYYNKWYSMDLKNARNLILLMIKTNKPFHLNIGKIFPLTMGTFCNLLKTSAGYVSVLLTTRNQSKL